MEHFAMLGFIFAARKTLSSFFANAQYFSSKNAACMAMFILLHHRSTGLHTRFVDSTGCKCQQRHNLLMDKCFCSLWDNNYTPFHPKMDFSGRWESFQSIRCFERIARLCKPCSIAAPRLPKVVRHSRGIGLARIALSILWGSSQGEIECSISFSPTGYPAKPVVKTKNHILSTKKQTKKKHGGAL
ncbi:unnamed protein product [Ixodes pacificus]